MNETPAMIIQALGLAGDDLTFSGFSIKGIVGFNLSQLYKGEQTSYGFETQNFSFQTSTENIVANTIVEGLVFTMTDGINTYTFEVSRTPIQDLTGWSEIHCNHIAEAILGNIFLVSNDNQFTVSNDNQFPVGS